LKKEKQHAEFSANVFWVTEAGEDFEKLEEKLALRPTSETGMYTMFSLWIRSWRDLPLKTYQTCQVWRYESMTRPFIRGREFYWIEGHDVFATEEEALEQVKEDMETTEKVMYEKCAIPFLFFKRPEHDKFKGAVSTFAADSMMPDGRAIQLPSTHFLGQNFSKAFDIKFVDKDGETKYAWQTCYGPAFWRILSALIAIHGDNKGLVLPPEIAPLQVVIVPILGKDDKKIMDKAEKVEKVLKENGFEVKLDGRKEYTPGWKYNYWELKGVPVRIEVGPMDVKKEQVIAVRRDTGEKVAIKDRQLVNSLGKLLEEIQSNLIKKADNLFKENLHEAKDFETLKKILEEKGGFVRVNWCGNKECADYIKAETAGGTIRGTLFGKKEKVFGKCVWCKKEAKEVVYVAKSY